MSASSSDSESDENMKNFMESVDTNFINDSMFQNKPKSEPPKPAKVTLPSQRHLNTEENVFQSDLHVTENMQKYVGKRLSEMIEAQCEFVETPQSTNGVKKKKTKGIKLLRDAEEYVTKIEDVTTEPGDPRKKVKISKRKVEADEEPEEVRLAQAAVELKDVQDTSEWKSRRKPKVFEYKTIKGVGYLREPENEFSKARKKNNWSESKIAVLQ